MLQLRDVHIAEAESLEDPELLMEVLEAREELEEAASEEEVEGLKKRNDGRYGERGKRCLDSWVERFGCLRSLVCLSNKCTNVTSSH